MSANLLNIPVAILAGGIVYKRVADPGNAREAFDAGMRLVTATRYDQAIMNFNRAVDLQPNFADAYRMRGRAYVAESNADQAIRDFNEAIRLDSKLAIAWANRGNAWTSKRKYDLANEAAAWMFASPSPALFAVTPRPFFSSE